MYFSSNYTRRSFWLAGIVATMLTSTGCNPFSIDPVTDPNNADITQVFNNPTASQLNALAVGVEASFRTGHTNNAPYNQMTGVLGREVLILASNEPRWYTQVLGTKRALDNNSFYSAGSYDAFARVIRAAQVLRQSASTAIPAILDDKQKQGVYGFADTYEALAKLHLVNLMGENGIRVDVADFLNPGKFTNGSAPAFASIRALLDNGAAELAKAGSDFNFSLSSGYADFDTPATFLTFNRALAARVALYQRDYAGAQVALNASFYDAGPNANFKAGPKLVFNPAIAGDQGNAYFQVPNSGPSTLVVVPDNFVAEADSNDARVASKVLLRSDIRSLSGVTGSYDPLVYNSQTAPLDIIRNEELVLISAEAKANSGNITGALADINTIRTRIARISIYSGPTTVAALNDEILKQRRYSLLYEGHRWIDLRRFGRLSSSTVVGTTSLEVAPAYPNVSKQQTIPYATGKYTIFDRMPKTFAEQAWDDSH